MIRYILTSDFRHLILNDGTKRQLSTVGVFVDLLEAMEEGTCMLVSVILYLPNGEILKGKVIGISITISNKDELFDGRFNSSVGILDKTRKCGILKCREQVEH